MAKQPGIDETVEAPVTAHRAAHSEPEAIGPYRVLERIGEGGMGVIYKAEQRVPVRRVVALKVIKLGMDTKEVLARFEAERQALALMSHPGIARVLDAGATETGRPFFAMEFVAGVPLTKYCVDQKLSTRQRLELLVQVCNAVQHAHQKGIIHRDLKPSNILVTLVDGKPVPKVIDFGIAKATSQVLTAQTLFTQTGALIGTPEYMSPEQAQTGGLDVDTRTDIYSLGVILYELLTGSLPFDPQALRTAGLEGMARMIRESEPQKPSTRLSGTPGANAHDTKMLQGELKGDLDWIVLKAMEKDRTRRYESASALAQDLERYLNDEPVLARPPSTRYRVGKFVQRHRGSVVAGTAVTAALVLGIMGTTLGLVRAREQRDKAMKAQKSEYEQHMAAESARENEKKANMFLRDLMVSYASPAQGQAGVARAAARLDEGWLKDQPETLVACRMVIGMFYISNNQTHEAEKQYSAILAAAKRPDGSVPPDISGVIHGGRGMAYWQRKEIPEAEHELRLAIEDYRKVPAMRAKVAQLLFGLSAVRLAQGDKIEAQKLVREATEIAATDPTMRGYITGAQVGQGGPSAAPAIALEQWKFQEAARELVAARMEDPKNHWNWYLLACLQVYLEDDQGYRQTAQGMLEQFSGTTLNTVRERTAKVCLLTPRPVGEMAQLQKLLDQALEVGPQDALYPWFALGKALAEYRQEKFESALGFLDSATALKAPEPQATIELIRAMALHRMGKAALAKEAMDRASNILRDEVQKPGPQPLESPENWLVCHVLEREAKQLLDGK
jgi:serine/threonine protein kinase